MLLNCGVEEDSWESFRLQGDPTKGNQSPISSLEGLMLKLKLQYYGHLIQRTDSFEKTLVLGKIEGGREGDNRGWDGWMASLTQWTWIWASSGSWWWTGRPSMLQSMGSQRVGHNWATELNWTELIQLYQHCWLYLFFTELPLCLCWNSTDHIWWMYFYTLYSLPLIYLSILIPIPYISISGAF